MSTRRATAAPISWSVILSDERSEKAIELRLVTSCLLSGKKCSLGSSREAAEFVLAGGVSPRQISNQQPEPRSGGTGILEAKIIIVSPLRGSPFFPRLTPRAYAHGQ